MKFITSLKDKKFRNKLLILLSLILITFGFYYYEKNNNRIFVENSLVSAPITNTSSEIAGKLMKVHVSEGDFVKKGDILAIVGTENLKAYSDGLVIKTNRQIGSIVNASVPVVQTINLNDIRIVGTIDENKGLNKIKVGQPVSFTVDAYPEKTYFGYVDEVAPSAKQTSLTFSISSERATQQFEIFVKYDPTKYPEIKNGMSAKMHVFTKVN